MQRKRVVVAGIVLLALAVSCTRNEAASVKAPYQGHPLGTLTSPIVCRADEATGSGYFVAPERTEGWERASEYARQSRTATWRITFEGERARVADGQGNSGLYYIVKRDRSGIVLVEVERAMSVQVVTIDPNTSSFVYTTQNASPMWNRASTFFGSCK